MSDNSSYESAINRASAYQGGDPLFVHIDGWNPNIVRIFKGFCKARGLTTKEGEARGRKTLRISKEKP